MCDLETSRMGVPYIYDISRLRVNINVLGNALKSLSSYICWKQNMKGALNIVLMVKRDSIYCVTELPSPP